MPRLPIYTRLGDKTPYEADLTLSGPGVATLRIAEDFAGREVEEEIPLDALAKLTGPESFAFDDILGLHLRSEGDMIEGLVGVGSGNERFAWKTADLAAALDDLSSIER